MFSRASWILSWILISTSLLSRAQGPLVLDSALAGDWITHDQLRIHGSEVPGNYLAVHAANGHEAHIDANGFLFSGREGVCGWSTRFDVLGHGKEQGSRTTWSASASCLEEDLVFHGVGMDVQYLHGEEGLRQNFLVSEEPDGNGPLRIDLHCSGPLLPRQTSTSGVVFQDAQGVERFSYSGLKVWDACGEVLDAHFEFDPDCDGALAIVVNDMGAAYPVTVDPVASAASTTMMAPIISVQYGRAVNTAGDVNGDGYSDVIVGAPLASSGESGEGLAYVYYGSASGLPTTPSVILQPNQIDANFGYAVSTAGDVNGDGFSDVLVGATTWESAPAQDKEGAVFVFHGSAAGLSTTAAVILQNNVDSTYLGVSVACAGDLNNDGYSDVIVGAPYFQNPTYLEGGAFVWMGSATGLNPVINKQLERNLNSGQFGISVSGIGDVNGDGYSDVAVGAFTADPPSYLNAGYVFIFHGSANGLGIPLNVAPALTLTSIGYSTNTGWCVSRAGDVNGDGYSDLVVGDYRGQVGPGPVDEGNVLVYHGSATGLPSIPNTILDSGQSNSLFGRSVSTAGDVNGDGYADIVVGGSTWVNPTAGEGAAWLYLGSPTGISTTALFRYELNISGGNMGESVNTAGDVNGDGYSDIIVGCRLGNRAVVYHGGAYNVAATPTATRYSGAAGARLGAAVADAGDVNGDGYTDVVIGAPGASNGQAGEGLAYVHYGSTSGLAVAPNVTLEANIAGASYGYSVSSAGDVNGDGYADVIIGAPNSGGTGRAYIYMGSAAGLSTAPALTLTGTAGSEYGYAVCTAGDVNSDGYADVVIGSPGNASAYVHWGRPPGTWPTPANTYTGAVGSRFGAAVSTAGDVNGSGYSSVIIGAPNYSNGQANEGGAYIYHGSNGGLNWTWNTLLEYNVANALFGTSVAGVGDVNGNGFYDVAVGAPGWANGQAGEGGVFVYFGTPAGITAAGMLAIQPNIVGVQLGYDVNEAGDVNGDGYADIVIGMPYLTNVEANEGRIWIVEGAPAGIGTNTQVESNTVGANMGWSVAGGGDVNGDGYSDIIGGAPSASPTLANEGGFYLFNGNQSRSLDRRTRQYQANLVSPLSTNSLDFANILYFGLGHRTRSHIQRNRARLRWEVVFEGQPFSGSPITNSVSSSAMSAAWTDHGVSGVEIKELVTKVPSHLRYKWRVREEYPMNKLIDGQRFSRWFYGYASGLGDIGILPVELLDFRGESLAEGNHLQWTTGSETGSDHFTVERSSDGLRFSSIGEVTAMGNSLRAVDYNFIDRTAPDGISYYRLRMVDLDANEDLSNVIAVLRSKGDLVVFPNPASDRITWTRSDGAVRVVIHDALGKIVHVQALVSGEASSASIAELPNGHYSLELLDAQSMPLARSRFIKAQAPIAP